MKEQIIFLCIVSILFCGCGQKKTYVTIENKDIEETEFQKTDNLWSNFEITESTLGISELCVGIYCVYDNKAYYEVNYFDSLIDQTGLSGGIPFEQKYNTEIRVYDMVCETDELIYKYDEERCIDISDMIFNGKYLVWEDWQNDDWQMKIMEPGVDREPRTIFTGAENEGSFWQVVPNVTSDKIYWYNQEKDNVNGINLYTYNFETQKIITERTGLDLASPYTMLPILENVYTVFAREENEKCSIFVHNIQTEEEIILNTPAEVCAPVSNRGYCVWKKGYDYEESKDIFTYDFKNHKAEQINLTEAYSFSHALLEHFVFVNQRGKSAYGSEGLYCFDMVNKVYQKLDIGEGEEDTILFTWQGMDENIYFQVGDETTDVRIFNIKVAQQCR